MCNVLKYGYLPERRGRALYRRGSELVLSWAGDEGNRKRKYDELFFFFMIHIATRYKRYQNYRHHKGDTTDMKSKLYLQIILLINYIDNGGKSVCYVRVVSWKAYSFTVFCQKKDRNKESNTWMDLCLRSRSCRYFIQKFHVLHYANSS